MADIHLHKLKDGRAFAECYKQLVANKPSTENLIMLGDAYMAIQVSNFTLPSKFRFINLLKKRVL